MKLDPYKLVRPTRESNRFVFTDDTNPGSELILHLRRLDPMEDEAAKQRADELTRMYMTGGFKDPRTGEWSETPLPFPNVGNEPIELSERALLLGARIERMQSAASADERYSAEEILSIAPCMPNAWSLLLAAVYRLSGGEDPKAVWAAYMERPSTDQSTTD